MTRAGSTVTNNLSWQTAPWPRWEYSNILSDSIWLNVIRFSSLLQGTEGTLDDLKSSQWSAAHNLKGNPLLHYCVSEYIMVGSPSRWGECLRSGNVWLVDRLVFDWLTASPGEIDSSEVGVDGGIVTEPSETSFIAQRCLDCCTRSAEIGPQCRIY